MIDDTRFITNHDAKEFFDSVNNAIIEIQNKGLYAEVNYSCSDYQGYTAIIIGRGKND